MLRAFFAFAFLVCTLAPTRSALAEPWTVEDLVRAEDVGGLEIAADGSVAVWVKETVGSVDGESKRVGQVWRARFDDPSADPAEIEPEPLTRDAAGVGGRLALSPDARHVAFTSTRERPGVEAEGPQLWALPLDGGEAFALTSFDRGVRDFAWIDDETLLVAREESPSGRERRFEERDDTSIAVDDVRDAPPVRLWRVGVGGDAERLTTNDDWIEEMAVAPGGERAVVRAGQSLSYQFDGRVPPRTFLVDLETGERTEILEDRTPEGSLYLPRSIQWADDDSFYFVDDFANHPIYRMATVARLHRYDVSTGEVTRVDAGWERGVGRGYSVVPGGVVALLADGVRQRPARLAVGGDRAERRDLGGEHARHLANLVVSRDGSTALYESSTSDRPPQLFVARLEADGLADPRQVGELNPSWAKKPTGRTEIVHWSGGEGDEVEGILQYPLDWQEGKRAPLVLDIHGGPAGTDLDLWSSTWGGPNILWRQKGAFVFQVNYHGSAGYGLEWVESIRERYYELEIPDIESGVDHLIERGLVDPERLAATGWSNGGILAAALIVHTDRYAAAIVGAADVEWISDWGNVDFGAVFDNYYFGGPPWEKLEVYIEKSPFFELEKVTTPTLVHTGDKDRAVPTHQSWSLFRALQQIGKAEVRFLLYPNEGHGLRKLAHRRRKAEEDVAWLDRHLFGLRPQVEEATRDVIPEDSRLASLLERAAASRVDGRLGVRSGDGSRGVLVPETTPFEREGEAGLEIGRFEVTRAQWAAFRPDDATASERDDSPVAGVGFADARAYVAWLSERTGETWRLPTKEEAESLAGEGGGGNTLDHWLGHASTPDDAAAVSERLESAGASLLYPVGHFGGTSVVAEGPRVFDLDGNVAEWAVVEGEGGVETGEAVGPSAERAADSSVEPDPSYVGLRVVRER